MATSSSKLPDTRDGHIISGSIERLPDNILNEFLQKMDFESLCAAACVSRCFRFAVSGVLSSLTSLDLSAFYLDAKTLKHVVYRVGGLKSLTVDCLHLNNDWSIINILGVHIQELNLLKCSSLSYGILGVIGQRCPNLRIFLIEISGHELPKLFKRKLIEMLQKVSLLESLSVNIRGTILDVIDLQSLDLYMPKSVKILKLQPTNERHSIHWIYKLRDASFFQLQSLFLVLNVISDDLIITIVNSLPILVELDLEDRPYTEPSMPFDLTNTGLQSLVACQNLTTLSIARNRLNYSTSFKRVDNLGMFLLSEGCRGLEVVKLGGFTKVTDAGFSSILHSCQNLKKFEVRNASLLSDLAFHDMREVAKSLVELRLLSCRLLTSEALEELSLFGNLEVLDTCGCRSIADPCISYISSLSTLTSLDLAEADITDSGLAILGGGNSPIARLSIRGCRRVTDKGIDLLLNGKGKLSKTISSLDVGHMPGISDAAISTIAYSAKAITDLCIRYCYYVTDAAVKTLAIRVRTNHSSLLRRLDIFNCRGLSDELIVQLLDKSSYRGLRWLGVGSTLLANKRDDFSSICSVRPWLTVCFDGCAFGCHDGWQFHKFEGCSALHNCHKILGKKLYE